MEKDNVLKHQENIKNFTLNRKIDCYKDFIDYIFNNLNEEIMDDIVFYTLIYKKYNEYIPDIKNGNLDKIYNMYKILLHKLEYNKLNKKEIYIYEYINSYLAIIEEFEYNKYFDIYCKNYLNNINVNNFNKRIFLIHQYLINDLNKVYNKNYKIEFTTSSNALASTNWFNETKKNKIILNLDAYLTFFYNFSIPKEDIKLMLACEIFTILHEYRHLLQKDYMLSNNDDISNQYKNDIYIIYFKNKLYKKHHDDLLIEKEANEFGFENIGKYLSDFIEYSYFSKRDIEDKLRKIYNNPTNNKTFLLQYKYLKYYLELFKKSSKKIKYFNNYIDEKKDEYKLTK